MRFGETQESKDRTATLVCFVWRVSPSGRRNRWYSWRVETVDKAREMVAWWAKREPNEYPQLEKWVVTNGEDGEVLATFTTKEALS